MFGDDYIGRPKKLTDTTSAGNSGKITESAKGSPVGTVRG